MACCSAGVFASRTFCAMPFPSPAMPKGRETNATMPSTATTTTMVGVNLLFALSLLLIAGSSLMARSASLRTGVKEVLVRFARVDLTPHLGSLGTVPLAEGSSLDRGWTTVRLDAVFSAFGVNTSASTGDPPRAPTASAHVDCHPHSGRGLSPRFKPSQHLIWVAPACGSAFDGFGARFSSRLNPAPLADQPGGHGPLPACLPSPSVSVVT